MCVIVLVMCCHNDVGTKGAEMQGLNPDDTMFCEQPDIADALERVAYYIREWKLTIDTEFGVKLEMTRWGWTATVKLVK